MLEGNLHVQAIEWREIFFLPAGSHWVLIVRVNILEENLQIRVYTINLCVRVNMLEGNLHV